MGTFSSWSYTAKCTVWAVTYDEYNQPAFADPEVFDCSFKAGGDLRLDDQQERFIPKTTLWLEAEPGSQPAVGSYVVIGESAEEEPPADAEVLRVVQRQDPSLFDEGTPDWVLMTG